MRGSTRRKEQRWNFPHFKNIEITGRTEYYSTLVSRLNQYAQVEFRAHSFHWNAIAVVYGYGHSLMQLHYHEHDEPRVSEVRVLTGEEGDCHGGAFFVEKGGIIHHEGKAIPTMGTRGDGSLVEGYLCDAQQHGVVFDSHALNGPRQWRGRRVALLFYTRAWLEQMREADVAQLRSLAFRWFEQCKSLLSLASAVLHACEWIFPLLLSAGVALSL